MSLLNRSQLIAISTLVSKLNIGKEDKAMMVNGFSGGRTETSKELSFTEATALIRHLKSLDPLEKKAETMRRKIMSFAHQMDWHIKGTQKLDMQRVDQWCSKFGYLHKKLNQYSYKELPKLITQFERAYNSYLDKV